VDVLADRAWVQRNLGFDPVSNALRLCDPRIEPVHEFLGSLQRAAVLDDLDPERGRHLGNIAAVGTSA
jgi:hypothetical protein